MDPRADESMTQGPGALAADACDSHVHVYAVPPDIQDGVPDDLAVFSADAYRRTAHALGLARAVIVTPRHHGTDNRTTLRAIEALGRERTRGVAVVHPDVDDAELHRLHEGGVRGLRFTLASPAGAVTSREMIEPLAARVARLGWHVQLHMLPAQIVDAAGLIERLDCAIVFDHLARLSPWDAACEQAWQVLERRARNAPTWFKLSGHYLGGGAGPASRAVGQLLAAMPGRLVWGSDWPHPTELPDAPPTDSTLQALASWIPDAAARRKILVDNPAALYGF